MTCSNRVSGSFELGGQKFPHRDLIAQHLLRGFAPPGGIEVKPAALENGLFQISSVHAPFSGQVVDFIKIGDLP